MSKQLILSMTVSGDGFLSGLNGEIDWMFPSMSPEGQTWVAEQFAQVGQIAIGHSSYQQMADFWPTADNPIAPYMNRTPKAVFSRSGLITPPAMNKTNAAIQTLAPSEAEPIRAALENWQNPIVAGTDLAADINRLKEGEGKPIVAIGGASFASSLIAADLVDVFRISVHPVALGQGMPFFSALSSPLRLRLQDFKTFSSGVIVKTYTPFNP